MPEAPVCYEAKYMYNIDRVRKADEQFTRLSGRYQAYLSQEYKSNIVHKVTLLNRNGDQTQFDILFTPPDSANLHDREKQLTLIFNYPFDQIESGRHKFCPITIEWRRITRSNFTDELQEQLRIYNPPSSSLDSILQTLRVGAAIIPENYVEGILCFGLGNLSSRAARIRHEAVRRYKEDLDSKSPGITRCGALDNDYSIPECKDALEKMGMVLEPGLNGILGHLPGLLVVALDVEPKRLHVLFNALRDVGSAWNISGPSILICPIIQKPPPHTTDFRMALWNYKTRCCERVIGHNAVYIARGLKDRLK
ncbi:hypothetical protein B0J11DRAFT_337139 [Dendryphion nanum]|uniref:Uncharacterized protein n=1 Tax=Dendryphion nanum TaxID=256645 RepID=A0A9P9DNH1_9PLEO|nr:hypothetical protein B0J11DRAFT_337139 [Dendryphion nanum]